MSNILDGKLVGRAPVERSHGEVVRAAVVDGKLLCKVVQRIERMTGIKAFLILPVAALHFAVMPGRIRMNELVADPQFCGCPLKQRLPIPFAD